MQVDTEAGVLTTIHEIEKGSRIFIFGTDERGLNFYHLAKEKREDLEFLGFIETTKEIGVNELPVHKHEAFINKFNPNDYDLLVVASIYKDQIVPYLQNQGVHKIAVEALPLAQKILFVHIPKVAGNSIRSHLTKYFGNHVALAKQPMIHPHSSILEIQNMLKERHITCDYTFKFAFVRNPWDRLFSLYSYHIKHPEMTYHGKSVASYGSFENFCEQVIFQSAPKDRLPELERSTQTSYLVDMSGRLIVDFVGRYENLAEDYKTVTQEIVSRLSGELDPQQMDLPEGLGWENKSPSYSQQIDYKEHYSQRTWEIVREKFRDDVVNFYPDIEFS